MAFALRRCLELGGWRCPVRSCHVASYRNVRSSKDNKVHVHFHVRSGEVRTLSLWRLDGSKSTTALALVLNGVLWKLFANGERRRTTNALSELAFLSFARDNLAELLAVNSEAHCTARIFHVPHTQCFSCARGSSSGALLF